MVCGRRVGHRKAPRMSRRNRVQGLGFRDVHEGRGTKHREFQAARAVLISSVSAKDKGRHMLRHPQLRV